MLISRLKWKRPFQELPHFNEGVLSLIDPKYNEVLLVPDEKKKVFQWCGRSILIDSNKWWMQEPYYWSYVEKPLDCEYHADCLIWQNIETKKPMSGIKICVWTGEMFFVTTWIHELQHTVPQCNFKLWSYVYETK